MKRGDLITVAMSGDFGKPRPAVVVQSDAFSRTETVTFLLITSAIIDSPLFRLTVAPTPENGLQLLSQIMIDKTMTAHRSKVGAPFGHLDDATMLEVTRLLALFLGFG